MLARSRGVFGLWRRRCGDGVGRVSWSGGGARTFRPRRWRRSGNGFWSGGLGLETGRVKCSQDLGNEKVEIGRLFEGVSDVDNAGLTTIAEWERAKARQVAKYTSAWERPERIEETNSGDERATRSAGCSRMNSAPAALAARRSWARVHVRTERGCPAGREHGRDRERAEVPHPVRQERRRSGIQKRLSRAVRRRWRHSSRPRSAEVNAHKQNPRERCGHCLRRQRGNCPRSLPSCRNA
eukprot:2140341-Pleurochrysis_carterae.AAC.2